MVKRCLLLLAVVWMVGAMGVPGSAAASAAAPGWEIFTRVAPDEPAARRQRCRSSSSCINTGAAVGEYPTITDTLPAGVTSSGGSLSVNDILNGDREPEAEGGECTGSGERRDVHGGQSAAWSRDGSLDRRSTSMRASRPVVKGRTGRRSPVVVR